MPELPWWDCHCHPQRAPDPRVFMQELQAGGVKAVGLCVQPADLGALMELKSAFASELTIFVGCHPQAAAQFDKEARQVLTDALRSPFVCGIGECGLDKRPQILKAVPLEVQLEALQFQLDLAYDLDLPVSLHCVKAHGDMLTLLRRWGGRLRVCLHAMSGAPELWRQYARLNCRFGIGHLTLAPDGRLLNTVKSLYPALKGRLLSESDYDGSFALNDFYLKQRQALSLALDLNEEQLREEFNAAALEFFNNGYLLSGAAPAGKTQQA